MDNGKRCKWFGNGTAGVFSFLFLSPFLLCFGCMVGDGMESELAWTGGMDGMDGT